MQREEDDVKAQLHTQLVRSQDNCKEMLEVIEGLQEVGAPPPPPHTQKHPLMAATLPLGGRP